ncbi:MAG: purine-binding chemotaxis protein CheW, partial [Oscillochloris sp.]|nr:purine-binding chemotaxis protein CheW [Oscillochloris sp.]
EQLHEDYLIVQVSGEHYALPGMAIREVARWRLPTPVPGAPAVLPGIISQRGVVLPTVNLGQLLGLATETPGRSARFVIVHQGTIDLALMVDSALDLFRLTRDDMEVPPVGLDPQRARLLRAIARYEGLPLLVLDLEALIDTLQESS